MATRKRGGVPYPASLKRLFGPMVKREIARQGVTQTEIAAHAGVSRSNFAQFLRGDVVLGPSMLQILNALGVSLTELLDRNATEGERAVFEDPVLAEALLPYMRRAYVDGPVTKLIDVPTQAGTSFVAFAPTADGLKEAVREWLAQQD